MTTRIITLLILTLVFSNMAWATSFEGLNCHNQEKIGTHITDHESDDNASADDCCECNILVLPNVSTQFGHTATKNYTSRVYTNVYSYFDKPAIPPPIS